MKATIKLAAALAVTCSAFAIEANAVAVTCGGSTGNRTIVVDPALDGGLCYSQVGNPDPAFTNTDPKTFTVGSTTLTLIAKEVVADGDIASSLLNFTRTGSSTSEKGTWAVSETAWNTWNKLYLGFHFGGGGDFISTNPDSFIVELARTDNNGTWEMKPAIGTQISYTGLSNIYLFGNGACQRDCNTSNVPEPASLALIGLALAGMGYSRRKTKSA